MKIESHKLKSNGDFGLLKEPFVKKQHPNQQEGVDLYVQVVDFYTGNINEVKLYKNKKGFYFKKGSVNYIDDFTDSVLYVPFQVIKPKCEQ